MAQPVLPLAAMPAPVALGRPATEADWAALPEGTQAHLIGGQLWVMPRPRMLHATTLLGASSSLRDPFHRGRGGPGGWIIAPEVDIRFGEDILAPDIAGWRRTRLPEIPATVPVEVIPDWLCEVLSPSTEAFDRREKMTSYGQLGVGWAWLIDPEARTLEVYENDAKVWRRRHLFRDAAIVRAEPFAEVAIELGAWWG